MPIRLLKNLERHAIEQPRAIAISPAFPGGVQLDWLSLADAVVRFSARLADVTQPGEVLLLCTVNRAEFAVVLLAALRAGLQAFPVSPSLTANELKAACEQTHARVAVGSAEAIAAVIDSVKTAILIDDVLAESAVPHKASEVDASTVGVVGPMRDADPSALLLHSSGTTAVPKIAVRSGRSLDAVSAAMVASVGFTRADRVLACVPLCHSYGIEHGLLAPIFAGSTVRLCQGFDLPTIMRELEAGITLLPGVPFIYETLARQAEGRRYPHLRRAYSAGGPLPATVVISCIEQLDLKVSQLYGATEIGSVTFADPAMRDFESQSVGRAMNGVEIRILPAHASADAELPLNTDGQIAIRAHSMFDRYFDGSPAPLADGFFLTGDLGRLDEYGNLFVTGRLKLLIDVAGLKVNPLEVEATLLQHPGVAVCIVIALPVSETVSRLKAIVVPAAGQNPPPQALRQFLRERLAPYKIPRVFEFRTSLPQSPTGKVLRRQVRDV